MMNRTFFIRYLLCGLLCIGIAMPAGWAMRPQRFTLAYTNEPLTDILQRLSRTSGFAIVVDGPGKDRPISGTIDNLPLDEAVREILRRFNSTIVWDDTNKAIVISLYVGSPGDGTEALSTKAPPEPHKASNDVSWFQQALEYSRQSEKTETTSRGRISGGDRRFIQATPTTEP